MSKIDFVKIIFFFPVFPKIKKKYFDIFSDSQHAWCQILFFIKSDFFRIFLRPDILGHLFGHFCAVSKCRFFDAFFPRFFYP